MRRMKKADLTNEIVKHSNLSRAAAADQLDRLVAEILQRVRHGEAANIPGLGTFRAGQEVVFSTEQAAKTLSKAKAPAAKKKGP